VDGTVHLALTHLDVRVRPAGHLAAFEVEHRFHNDGDDALEGTFRFTLPPGAVVTGLAMNIGEEMMEGEFVDRDKARRTFEKIVDSMRDPALLEWQQGKAFKLRVFPIEPHADKRVVLRYLAPLGERTDGSPEIVIPLAAADLQRTIDHVDVHLDGPGAQHAPSLALDDVIADRVLRLRVPDRWRQIADHDVMTELAEGERFTAVRIRPRWDRVAASAGATTAARRVVLVVDSSRSALEAWPRVQEAVTTLARTLGPDDEIALLTADVTVEDRGRGFATATPARASALVAALHDLEPDGASDLGAALEAAVSMAERPGAGDRRTQIILLGDGAPTWGELDPGGLNARLGALADHVEVHALALGRRADVTLLRALTGHRGGTVIQPSQPRQLDAAADFFAHTHQIRSMRDVSLSVDGARDVDVVLPPGGTWFEGEEPVAYLRSAEDSRPPRALTLRGTVAGQPVVQRFALETASQARGLSRLWAAAEIDAVAHGGEDAAMKKEQTILLSQRYGVLSRHTSLLVLESEEAYEAHQIERRQAARRAAESADPTVSGADLESVGLSPGDLQPGDPEIHIPAPEDALSVAVVFPFGETKLARWDATAGDWTVRFLVADDTPAGTYDVRVRVTHADGRVELGTARYSIDMTAPSVDVRIVEVAGSPGTYRVIAEQRLTDDDAARERSEGVANGTERATTLDLGRVRVVMPDGQTLMLRRMGDGHYARNWTPRAGARIDWPASVEVAVTDRALNTRTETVSVEAVVR
jgi:uncharacterized protein YegL